MELYVDYNQEFMIHDLYALYKCLYLWEFLKHTGHDQKMSFYSKRNVIVEEGSWACPCCDNARLKTKNIDKRCRVCILNEYAWKSNDGTKYHCVEHEDALFNLWDISSNYQQRMQSASKMVDAIKKAIRDLELKRLRKRR